MPRLFVACKLGLPFTCSRLPLHVTCCCLRHCMFLSLKGHGQRSNACRRVQCVQTRAMRARAMRAECRRVQCVQCEQTRAMRADVCNAFRCVQCVQTCAMRADVCNACRLLSWILAACVAGLALLGVLVIHLISPNVIACVGLDFGCLRCWACLRLTSSRPWDLPHLASPRPNLPCLSQHLILSTLTYLTLPYLTSRLPQVY